MSIDIHSLLPFVNVNMFTEFLGVYLKEARERKKLGYKALSLDTKIPQMNLKKMEDGEELPSRTEFSILCMRLELDIEHILTINKMAQVDAMGGFLNE